MDKDRLIFSNRYFLTAGQCNAQSRLPLPLLVERLIETATDHANRLDIGYDRLNPLGLAWVLSRVAIIMYRWPGVNSAYSLTTWIESSTRVTSNRCFRIDDADGNIIGYARTIWAAIDINCRSHGDLTFLNPEQFVLPDTPCPAEVIRRVSPGDDAISTLVTFRYSDIDFNRHVNSVRYVDRMLDALGLEFFDNNSIKAFAINYMHETYCGDTLTLTHSPAGTDIDFALTAADGTPSVIARLSAEPI